MATIQIKRGAGAPTVLLNGEPALDQTNKRLYIGYGGAVYLIGGPKTAAIELLTPAANATIQGNGTTWTATNTPRFGGASHYSDFEADGTLHFTGDATVWDDMRILPSNFDRPGASDPASVQYTPGGSGTAMYLWEFARADEGYFTVQLPHSYKQGTDITVHAHWTPGANGVTENGKTVFWELDYSWANINGAFAAASSVSLHDTCTGVDHAHLMSDEGTIDGHTAAKNISSMLICKFYRHASGGGADDWAGTLSGALPLLLEVDFHYEIDTVGSRARATK